MTELSAKLLVIGAGVTGLRTAVNLTEMGHEVILVDRAPAPGGLLLGLEHQFPTDHCGLCRLEPHINVHSSLQSCWRRGLLPDGITFLGRTTVTQVDGLPGDLQVNLESIPPGIDPGLCTACGACAVACPVEVPDPFNFGLTRRKAVHPAAPFSPAGPWIIDWSACTKCRQCVLLCPTKAIDLDGNSRTECLARVALIILATGRNLFDPAGIDLYGGGTVPNVLTAAAFERLISPAGPYGKVSPSGVPHRPSDGQEAKRVAWIQCVGSRNLMLGANYCSNVCCSYAVKQASLTRVNSKGKVDTTVFYMDLRTFGRDLQRYKDRAEKELGVKFMRCRVHSLDLAQDANQVRLYYSSPGGGLTDADFDLVVLANGMSAREADSSNQWSKHPGVLTADSAASLMDIAESVMAADAITAGAMEILCRAAGAYSVDALRIRPSCFSPAVPSAHPQLLAIFWSPINNDLDWDGLGQSLPSNIKVAYLAGPVDKNNLPRINRIVRKLAPDRVMILAPGPGLASLPAIDLARGLGLPAASVELIDYNFLLDPQTDINTRSLTLSRVIKQTARRLLARTGEPPRAVPITRSILIVGGGPTGMAAALTLANQGIKVTLAEKEPDIAGTITRLHHDSQRQAICELAEEVRAHPSINVRTGRELVACRGTVGNFSITMRRTDGGMETLICGAIILATGGGAAQTQAYGLGLTQRIVTVSKLHEMIGEMPNQSLELDNLVFIQCAGSREEPHNYCSRICCPATLETAIRIKDLRPQAKITVFYRDIMTYGHSEELYTEARGRGVLFIPFEPSSPPLVTIQGDHPQVDGYDPWLQETVRLTPDWVALATGVSPGKQEQLARVFGLSLTRDGFLKEADVKWKPLDSREGLFVSGLARAPARLDEALREGLAAAGRAMRLLNRSSAVPAWNTARVNDALCVHCLLCLPVCPYRARAADDRGGSVIVDTLACQGCGTCVSACPAGAATVADAEEEGLLAVLE